MITVSGKETNNIREIIAGHQFDTDTFLREVKVIGDTAIDGQTPVITGNLKSGNISTIDGDNVKFFNKVHYFPFVHFGTMYMSANPYMLRGLINSNRAFANSLIKNLKV